MTTRAAFLNALVEWLNAEIAPSGARVSADTTLFATGMIDSIGILRLIAWTECAAGCTIPDSLIRMDNFSTPARIADVFAGEAIDAAA